MIYFVRHTDKSIGDNYNAKLGICDDPLSEKGMAAALRIAYHFREIVFEKIIASQYIRTQQTTRPLAEHKRLSLTVDERVNEINNGELRNMSEAEAAAAFPEIRRDFNRHGRDVRFPGGESGADVKRRQDSFLEDMKKEKGNVLVVSHDGYIRLLMCNIFGLPVYMRYRFKTDMGGISAIEYDGAKDEWKIVTFNLRL